MLMNSYLHIQDLVAKYGLSMNPPPPPFRIMAKIFLHEIENRHVIDSQTNFTHKSCITIDMLIT